MGKEKKETFTYTTLPSIKAKAKKKAEREGWSLSEKIDQLLRAYVKAPVWKSTETGKPVREINIGSQSY